MIIFRTHAAKDIGFGRLIRTSRIADHLKGKNKLLFFINNNKQAKKYLSDKKIAFKVFKGFCSEYMENQQINLAVFDLKHYHPSDLKLIKYAHQNQIKTFQFTDLGLSVQKKVQHIIDPSLKKINPYPKNSNAITDPDYFILHHNFRHFYLAKKHYKKKLNKLFISLGGAAPYRELRKIIDFLYRYGYQLKVAPGYTLKNNQIKILRRLYPRIKFVGKTETLARSFYESDVALITSGITAYEACCTGTPALYMFYNKEQEFMADTFEKMETGIKISSLFNLDRERLLNSLKNLDMKKRKKMGDLGKSIIDGKGIYRIIDFLKKLNIINI